MSTTCFPDPEEEPSSTKKARPIISWFSTGSTTTSCTPTLPGHTTVVSPSTASVSAEAITWSISGLILS